MNKKILYIVANLILLTGVISCGSKGKYTGEVRIHFEKNIQDKNSYKEIIQQRLERLDIRKFKIEELPDGFSINIAQLADTTLVLDMLAMNEKLGFWETYENEEVYPWLEKLNNQLASRMPRDTTADSIQTLHPLFYRLQLNIYQGDDNMTYLAKGSIAGYAKEENVNSVDSMLSISYGSPVFPHQLVFMWGQSDSNGIVPLHALKMDDFTNGPFMESKEVEKSKIKKRDNLGRNVLNLKLTEEGARIFKNFTKKNIGKQIAISFGSTVIMSPSVESEINGGLVDISRGSDGFLKYIEYALRMPMYPSAPVLITHHFELRK